MLFFQIWTTFDNVLIGFWNCKLRDNEPLCEFLSIIRERHVWKDFKHLSLLDTSNACVWKLDQLNYFDLILTVFQVRPVGSSSVELPKNIPATLISGCRFKSTSCITFIHTEVDLQLRSQFTAHSLFISILTHVWHLMDDRCKNVRKFNFRGVN